MELNLPNGPDPASMDPADWIQCPFPAGVNGRRDGQFDVVVKQSTFNRLYAHAHATTNVEVCGVLVGNVCHDGRSPFLHITGNIPGAHADHHASRVTFTSDTWTHFHDVLEREHRDQRIVGWYHTHPGFGIFLSGMDLFIHNNFFSLPWQVAYVYDPLGGDEGLFVWQAGMATRSPALIEPDAPCARPPISKKVSRPVPADEADVTSGTESTDQRPFKRLKQWFSRGSK